MGQKLACPHHRRVGDATESNDAMVDQETGVRGYLITGDEQFLEPYHRGGNAYTAAIQKIKRPDLGQPRAAEPAR
jgi:methyl-accepting chemotaxis protein